MLLAGRKLTAIEAHQAGIVSQVFWPTSMMQEVIPRVQNMAEFSAKVGTNINALQLNGSAFCSMLFILLYHKRPGIRRH